MSRWRNQLLLGLAVIIWAFAVSFTVAAFRPPPPENPTCRELRDAAVREHTIQIFARELDRPPRVSRRERAAMVARELDRACGEPGSINGREGRRRPVGADLRGTVTQRLRELEARRR